MDRIGFWYQVGLETTSGHHIIDQVIAWSPDEAAARARRRRADYPLLCGAVVTPLGISAYPGVR